MSYRGIIEKTNSARVKEVLRVAAQDVLLSEAAKNDGSPKSFKAKEYLNNLMFNTERLADLAMVHDQDLVEDSPDSKYRKAIEDVFDILSN